MARPETVVDYDAWKRGYMPPSEHYLIDQLAYRGARVVHGTDLGEHGAFWIVMRGKSPNAKIRKLMREILDMVFEDEECSPETISLNTSQTTTGPVTGASTVTTVSITEGGSTDASASDGAGDPVPTGTPSKQEPGTN